MSNNLTKTRTSWVNWSGFIPLPNDGQLVGAYVLEHKQTGKVYVGSTHDLYERLKHHKAHLSRNEHHCKLLQNLYNSKSNIHVSFYLVHKLNRNEKDDIEKYRQKAYKIEQELINEYHKQGLLLNRSLDAFEPYRGYKRTDEEEQYRTERLRESMDNPELRQLRSVNAKKQWQDPDKRKKIREKHNKRLSNPEERNKLLEFLKGQTEKNWKSPEFLERMSEKGICRKVSIDGHIYPSINAAARDKKMSSPGLATRLKSKYWPTWFFVDNTTKDL